MQKRHALETGGLYARIRHPGYLGSWLVTAGTVLAFGSAVTVPLAIVMLGLLIARTRVEEELLARHFGDEYRRYRGRTGAAVPPALARRARTDANPTARPASGSVRDPRYLASMRLDLPRHVLAARTPVPRPRLSGACATSSSWTGRASSA